MSFGVTGAYSRHFLPRGPPHAALPPQLTKDFGPREGRKSVACRYRGSPPYCQSLQTYSSEVRCLLVTSMRSGMKCHPICQMEKLNPGEELGTDCL